jgi:hypothetical protein
MLPLFIYFIREPELLNVLSVIIYATLPMPQVSNTVNLCALHIPAQVTSSLQAIPSSSFHTYYNA